MLKRDWLMWLFVAAAIIFSFELARADEADGVKLEEVSLDYAWYKSDTRDTILYPVVPTNRLDLRINFSVLRYLYFNSLVHSETAESQFKTIGWNYQLGVHLGPVDLYGEHYSQHVLDGQDQFMPYPVQNLIGIKWYIYRGGR